MPNKRSAAGRAREARRKLAWSRAHKHEKEERARAKRFRFRKSRAQLERETHERAHALSLVTAEQIRHDHTRWIGPGHRRELELERQANKILDRAGWPASERQSASTDASPAATTRREIPDRDQQAAAKRQIANKTGPPDPRGSTIEQPDDQQAHPAPATQTIHDAIEKYAHELVRGIHR